jgi:pimeloyl-ACP methyl ester carboxylesterase
MVEVLTGLTQVARSGNLISSSKILSGGLLDLSYKPAKTVHVAHSQGSLVTLYMLANHGDAISDGVVLTGALLNGKIGIIDVDRFNHDFAAEHDPKRFGEYKSGYIVPATPSDLQKLFLHKGGFDQELLAYMDRVKQPEAVGIYSGAQGFANATGFTGPVLFVSGNYDFVLCDGDCRGQYSLDAIKGFFPVAKNVSIQIQPKAGHALTFAYGASEAYAASFRFLDMWGL